jgi:elongator complex protein 3
VGSEVPVGRAVGRASEYQHRGFGRSLLEAAEAAVRDAGFDRVYVTSAVGTREYYRARGYARAGAHMAKGVFAGHNPAVG